MNLNNTSIFFIYGLSATIIPVIISIISLFSSLILFYRKNKTYWEQTKNKIKADLSTANQSNGSHKIMYKVNKALKDLEFNEEPQIESSMNENSDEANLTSYIHSLIENPKKENYFEITIKVMKYLNYDIATKDKFIEAVGMVTSICELDFSNTLEFLSFIVDLGKMNNFDIVKDDYTKIQKIYKKQNRDNFPIAAIPISQIRSIKKDILPSVRISNKDSIKH